MSAAAPGAAPEPTPGPTGPTMLVVDDVDGSRLVFASWLRRAGYTVLEAATGQDALDLIARTSLDLVVLDVHLPDMSGLDVCEYIKRTRATAAIPVLHVSATATAAVDRSNALNRGADGYLFEPIEREELLATVASLLRYHDARRAAERMATRLERLHQSTLLMNAAPTVADLLQFACTGLASVFGTSAAVVLNRDDVGRVALATPNELEPTIAGCSAADVIPVATAAQAGMVADLSAFDHILGPRTGAVVASPIATPRGDLIGAVLLLTDRCPPEDELMLDHFAQALAVAVENQRLYALEHRIALTLQRSMLPASIPQPEYVELAVRYLAASDAVEIGGDFYEAVELSDQVTLIAVGDVVGHSLQAATVMAELRHTLRAFASLGMSLVEIIDRLGTQLRESHPGVTATMCIAEIDRAGEIRIANAGQVPPVLRDADGTRLVAEHGSLLGLRAGTPAPLVVLPFGAGASVVLVTDGLVERRREDLGIGLDRLLAAVADDDGDAEGLCDRILDTVGAGADTFDDIAIVVARSRPGDAAPAG